MRQRRGERHHGPLAKGGMDGMLHGLYSQRVGCPAASHVPPAVLFRRRAHPESSALGASQHGPRFELA